MNRREIVLWPDTRLMQKCSPVSEFDVSLEQLIDELFSVMYAAEGRGLAAPQIGEMNAVFVMDATWKKGTRTPRAFVNPEIIDRADEVAVAEEGCLSIPGVTAEVERPTGVSVAWQDAQGACHGEAFSGFEALCIQHEVDHLNGIVTLDRLDVQQRARVLKAYAVPLA